MSAHAWYDRLFLEHCTDKNPVGESKETGSCSSGVNKYTPLHVAAKYGQLEVFEMIGEWVPDINPPSSLLGDQIRGLTPLHLAARYGHLPVCERIIDVLEEERILEFLDHNKNPPDVNGLTPLHCAAYGGHVDVCQLLLDHIDEKRPLTGDGLSPMDYAWMTMKSGSKKDEDGTIELLLPLEPYMAPYMAPSHLSSEEPLVEEISEEEEE